MSLLFKPSSFKSLLFLLCSPVLGAEDPNQEHYHPENPSLILGSEVSEIENPLSRQVGKALITEKEKAIKRAEEERLAKMEAKEKAKEEARLARIAQRKTSSTELPKTCLGYTGVKSYKIARGVTLGKIGAEVYGNPAYSTLVSVFNKKPANRLYLGETLKTPSPQEIFTKLDGNLVREKYPYAIRDCLRIHEDFKLLEETIIAEKKSGRGYTPETKDKLNQMIWQMEQVKKDFFDKVEGVNEFPVSTTTQLHSAYTNLKKIRRGDLGRKNLRLQRVHIYLINAYSYTIAWGRDGFSSKKK